MQIPKGGVQGGEGAGSYPIGAPGGGHPPIEGLERGQASSRPPVTMPPGRLQSTPVDFSKITRRPIALDEAVSRVYQDANIGHRSVIAKLAAAGITPALALDMGVETAASESEALAMIDVFLASRMSYCEVGIDSLSVIARLVRARIPPAQALALGVDTAASEGEALAMIDVFLALRANPRANVLTDFGKRNIFILSGAIARLSAAACEVLGPAAMAMIAKLKGIAGTALAMQADRYEERFVARLSQHRLGLYLSGITGMLPRECLARGDFENRKNGVLTDESGREFDDLRGGGPGSVMGRFAEYLQAHGGNQRFLMEWGDRQAASSWSFASVAMKWLTLQERTPSPGLRPEQIEQGAGYYMGPYTRTKMREEFERVSASYGGPTVVRSSFIMYRALMLELFSTTKLPGVTPDGHVLTFRSEAPSLLRMYKLTGDVGTEHVFPRGPFESLSVTAPVPGLGSEVFAYAVPIHRIGGFYGASFGEGSFFHFNAEKEVVANLEGLPAMYFGRIGAIGAEQVESLFRERRATT